MLLSGNALAAPPGAVVSNQARLEYQSVINQPVTVLSNTVEVTTAVLRTPASIGLTRVVGSAGAFQETVGPSACLPSGAFVGLPDPQARFRWLRWMRRRPASARRVLLIMFWGLGSLQLQEAENQ